MKRTMFTPPSPDERRRNVEALKWWWFDANNYKPHRAQVDLHLSRARFRMAIAGTRGGKSRFAGEEAVPYLFAGATRIWIVGQTYQSTEKEFRYIYDRMTSEQAAGLFNGTPPLEKATYNEKGGDMYLRTKWGAEVKCISLDKAETAAFGDEVDLIILSEPAQIKNPQRVYQRILHGRLASRLGDLLLPGTPSGKAPKHDPESWVYGMYMKGLGDDPNYFTRQWASWENPDFKDDPYWLRSWMNPKIFAEQYCGEFVTFSGAVYESFDKNVHIIPPFTIPRHWNRYESIDPGYSGLFFWGAGVVGYDNTLYIINEYSAKKTLYQDHASAIIQLREMDYQLPRGAWKNFEKSRIAPRLTLYIDPEDPQCIAELAYLGLYGYKADNNVHIGIDRVERRLRYSNTYLPKLYITDNCRQIIEALEFHQWGEKEGIDERKPAEDVYKHSADIVRYICMGNLVSSMRKDTVTEPNEPTLYDIMEDSRSRSKKHPFDLNREDRREIYSG